MGLHEIFPKTYKLARLLLKPLRHSNMLLLEAKDDDRKYGSIVPAPKTATLWTTRDKKTYHTKPRLTVTTELRAKRNR